MMNKFIENLENHRMKISEWSLGFIGIIFVRFILESLSSPTPTGIIASDVYTLVHYGLFFLTAILGLICIVGYFTKNYLNTSKFILFTLPILWVAPIFDIILSGGKGYVMSYVYDTPKEIIIDFFKFPTLQHINGITYGMTICYTLLLIFIGYYVWLKRKNIKAVVLAVLLSYIFMFILGTLPSLIYAIAHIQSNGVSVPLNITYYLNDLITKSNIFHNTLHETAFSVTPFRFFQLGFDKLMSQIFFIISFFLTIIFFWKVEPEKFKALIKNLRPERIFYYLTPFIFAVVLAYMNGYGKFSSWVDLLGFISLLLAWLGIWMYSIHQNDIVDIHIDTISNSNRPLIQKSVTPEDMEQVGYICLALAFIGSWSAGYYPFFMALVGIAVAHIYSVPPLRLRRVPILSSFLISLVILAATLSGFFFVSYDKQVQTFPMFLAIGILIMYTLEINFRDMKDIEGDRAEGIETIPMLFGDNGPQVTGLLFATSFLLAPIFLSFYILYILAIPGAYIGYKLITKKPYKEKFVFVLHFAFLTGIVIFFLGGQLFINIYNIL